MQPNVVFRDPPPVEERAAELEREIARVLVRAQSLPVDLPMFKLALHGVEISQDSKNSKGGIHLVLGRDGQRLAVVRLVWPEGEGAMTTSLRWEGPVRREPDRQNLETLQQRLRAGISRARWEEADKLAEAHRELPRNVPLEAFRQLVPGSRAAEGLVRTGFNCNQDCGLCWQGREWGRVQAPQILAWIEDLRKAGAATLIISGGEPTLDARLVDYIKRARDLGYELVTLETNAIQMAKPGYAQKLREAGLQRAFVSLHSGEAAISDEVTRAPGTHKRTVLGIKALLEVGVRVALNAVITAESVSALPDLPDFVRDTFGDHPCLETLVISDLGATFEDDLLDKLAPEPAVARAALAKAIDRACALGLRIDGLAGPCGPPLCMFEADTRVIPLTPIPAPVPFRKYLDKCGGCAVRDCCYGVRERHVELFGADWVRPLAVRPTPRRRADDGPEAPLVITS